MSPTPRVMLNNGRLHRLLLLGQERQNRQNNGTHTEYQQEF